MIFWSHPPSGKCEWLYLYGFVNKFNSLYGKSYRLEKCLDVANRETREPEVLLTASGDKPIVLERKSVVWPQDYFKNLRNQHYLHDEILELLSTLFQDTVYQLNVNEVSLKNKKKSEIKKIAEDIASAIIKNLKLAKEPCGLQCKIPFPWNFRPLSQQERDEEESIPERGIGLLVHGTDPFEISEIGNTREIAKIGFRREFENVTESAAKKFVSYEECLKILLVQFCGDYSYLMDEELIEIINAVELPILIDQVWIARHDWINQDEYEIDWELARR